jgi:hypothetical protein
LSFVFLHFFALHGQLCTCHCACALLQGQLERLRREEEAAQRAANDLVEAWKRAKAEADDAAVRCSVTAAD